MIAATTAIKAGFGGAALTIALLLLEVSIVADDMGGVALDGSFALLEAAAEAEAEVV